MNINTTYDTIAAFRSAPDPQVYVPIVTLAVNEALEIARRQGYPARRCYELISLDGALNQLADIDKWQRANAEFLTIPQTAKVLGVSERLVYKMVADGRLVTTGKPKRIKRSDLSPVEAVTEVVKPAPKLKLRHLKRS